MKEQGTGCNLCQMDHPAHMATEPEGAEMEMLVIAGLLWLSLALIFDG